jgi:Concanavalin A-like lectin/glucanases superfamily/Abnormal spindle-like microcephaly-assoc'd, ASPM-SPD-2-Hydin
MLTAAFMVFSSITARAADYSNWLKNISAAGDPDSLYIHNCVKVAVSGNYVHVAWLGTKKDWSDGAIFYTHSDDGGITFSVPKILASGLGQSQEAFPPEFNNLAVDGQYVHLVYVVGWPRKFEYLRSTDNGTTFAPAQTLSTGYFSYTAYLAAEGGKLAIAWSGIGTDAPQPKWINCTYSNDGGSTFDTTQMAYSTVSPYDFSVIDAVRSGNYVYILTRTTDWNYGGSTARIFLWASWDGGATFKTPVKVTVPADDTNDYARTIQNVHYSPNLVASGLTVNITWVNIDVQSPADFLWTAPTLRTRRSTDGGLTLLAPVTLHTFPSGYTTGANYGQETIAGNGNNLYITTVLSDAPAGTYIWRSTDAGATWKPASQISTGGWWPLTRVDPSNSTIIHTVNSSYFLSKDSGASFNGGVNPHTLIANWDAPQMAVDASGVVHYAAPSGGPYTNEIFYRRIAAPPSPSTTEMALTVLRDNSGTRSDNMQVAARTDLNFTTAMTLEFWARRDTDDTNTPYFEPMVGKKRLSGFESYGIGAWADAQVYARLVTSQSASAYGGDWIGSGVSMTKGQWYHLALTYDASLATDNIKLFVNGELCGRANLKGAIVTETMDSPLLVGNNDGGVGGFSIDELRIWNKPLAQADIVARMGNPLAGSEGGLVAYYNFNGTTKDISGHGHDGILMYRESYTVPGAVVSAKPEIVVTQPTGGKLVDGTSNMSFGAVKIGKTGKAKVFTIKNTGTAMLTGLSVTKGGIHASNFIVTKPTKSKLAPGISTTFKVSFKPTSKGNRKAAIHIKSNDADENPFDIKLTGKGEAR